MTQIGHAIALVEDWLQSHLDLLALGMGAVGFLIRVLVSDRNFVNPDEALHYLLANRPSAFAAYKASLTSAHPPFFFILLYFVRFFGNSEPILRLPSVLAGTALSWVVFKWLGNILGRNVAFIGLLLLTFSPTMFTLSAEIRGYAIFLLFEVSALYFLELAFEGNSHRMMAFFSLFLYLAILTEYAALWFTLAIGLYSLMRVSSSRIRTKLIWVWLASQAGALALYAFLYVTHVSKLRGSGMEQQAVSGWLSSYYFQPGKGSLLRFPLKATLEFFQYVFDPKEVGTAMFLVFLVGLGFLLAKDRLPGQAGASSRELGILLALPFLVGSGAAIARIYPYGGSRHSVYLALFATAGASFALVRLGARKLLPGLLAAVVLLAVSNSDLRPVEFIHPDDQTRVLINEALHYIHQSISSGQPILVDGESELMLHYYLCRNGIFHTYEPQEAIFEFPCGGYRLVTVRPWGWASNPEGFAAGLNRMVQRDDLKFGERVWVVHAGWGGYLHAKLATQFPVLNRLPHQNFGHNISIFQVAVGSVASPAKSGQ